MEKNLDITNPPFNEQIWPVPSDFVKSRFHCTLFQTLAGIRVHVSCSAGLFLTSKPSILILRNGWSSFWIYKAKEAWKSDIAVYNHELIPTTWPCPQKMATLQATVGPCMCCALVQDNFLSKFLGILKSGFEFRNAYFPMKHNHSPPAHPTPTPNTHTKPCQLPIY